MYRHYTEMLRTMLQRAYVLFNAATNLDESRVRNTNADTLHAAYSSSPADSPLSLKILSTFCETGNVLLMFTRVYH